MPMRLTLLLATIHLNIINMSVRTPNRKKGLKKITKAEKKYISKPVKQDLNLKSDILKKPLIKAQKKYTFI